VLPDVNRSLRRAYALAALRGAGAQGRALDRAWSRVYDLRNRLSDLEPPRTLAAQTRTWSARIDAVDDAAFALRDEMARPDDQAAVNRRYAALRRAIRAEYRARGSVLGQLELDGSVPALPQETSLS
jgi:hypothetical protein